jgi:hypothetical protein
MPSAREIRERVAWETERRNRLAVPAFAGGVLYLLSGIVISSTLRGAPTVGVLQGLAPALRGEANPSVSPRATEVRFIDHHAFGLIAGSALAAIAVGVLTLVLMLVLESTRFRRPETWRPARSFVLAGGIGVIVLNFLHAVVLAITTHGFTSGHDFTNHAADRALLTAGAPGLILGFAGLLAALALAVGMGVTMMAAMRVGLLPRWLSILGIFAGVFFLPFFANTTTLELITAFWLVAMGILLMGRWPNGEPPAWAAGEARPWPTQAEARAAREAGKAQPALSAAGADVAPAPASPASSRSSRKRRRKGRARH